MISCKAVSFNNMKTDVLTLMQSKSFKEKIFDWQFNENPKTKNYSPIVLVDQWGTVIGFNGVMPVEVKTGDEIINGIWSCDFYVDERFRGKGFGKEIKNLIRKYSPLIMAFGISESASHVHFKMGWKSNLDVEGFQKVRKIRDIKSPIFIFIQLFNKIRNPVITNDIKYNFTLSKELPEKDLLDDLWKRVASQYKNIVIRNAGYLYWKYQHHPLTSYDFIIIKNKNVIEAILIVRITGRYVAIVDYIGPDDDSLKKKTLKYLLQKTRTIPLISCTTSDIGWKKVLMSSGFRHSSSRVRFHIYSQITEENNWFIMTGDSDGDLLAAAEDGPFKDNVLPEYTVEQGYYIVNLDEEKFSTMQGEWNSLLERSSQNMLFLSWEWQYYWWKEWSKKMDFKLLLLGVYNKKDELVALAPLYQHVNRYIPGINSVQIQFIGSSWGITQSVRSEYLDFIIDNKTSNDARVNILSYLQNEVNWDVFVLADIDVSSLTTKWINEKKYFRSSLKRIVQKDATISINTSGQLSDYKSCLGSNTRYRAFNRRKNLEALEGYKIEYATIETLDDYFSQLNTLHKTRWDKLCFYDSSLLFHKNLSRELLKQGRLLFSRISVAGKPISLLYNMKIKDTVYNIQAGFNEKFEKNLSLGLLHLGISIEDAFNDAEINKFDMLAGEGKNSFYKSHFGSSSASFITLQVLNDNKLKKIYSIFDELPASVRTYLMKNLKRKTF